MSGVYGKPLHDYRERLEEFKVPVVPDFVIDDYPGIVSCFGGMQVPEYLGRARSGGADDRVLDDVYDVIRVRAAGGVPDHPRYRPGDGHGAAIPKR